MSKPLELDDAWYFDCKFEFTIPGQNFGIGGPQGFLIKKDSHCPKGVSHYIKNIGNQNVRIVSYIFPGNWAEDFFAETSKQNKSGIRDLKLIEEKFGVVYL